ncbi:MAG: hypothetical protein A2521_01575 [Deltaproteobacteria bacterium RIFOXYD12_FULL_57_12]|nr:MAG: hypothetical protein A2521_01575 [Deltaproteobacteria bacterium RIFOXYD12_FULL_57_12]
MVREDNREILLKGTRLDFTLENEPGRTGLVLRNLEMQEPGLRLQGTIERQQPAGHDPEDTPPSFWRLDLQGRDLDLAAIRKDLLELWPENPVAKEVCAIVLGGTARQAAFRFAGPAADFHRLEAMQIMARAEHVPLLVPGANLALTETAGSINIVNGILSGRELSTKMQESQAENGQLFLGLHHGDKPFLLDMDLSADVAALPDVLRRLVGHQGFRDELERFTGVQGSASGHLRLGDHLHAIATEVTVNSMKASAEYDRLPWPFTIAGGKLRIQPGKAEWQEIHAVAGPHTIHDAGGAVTWKEAVDLRLDQCRATLAGQNLFEELRGRGLLPDRVSPALAAINGTLEVNNLSLHGPPTRPADWQYRLDLRSDALHVASPLAGGPLLLKKTNATIDQEKIMLVDSLVGFPDSPLQISGEFSHHLLENWSGRLRLNGTVMATMVDRIKEKNWLPESFFPRLPVTLQDLDITWDKASTSIAGGLVAGAGQSTDPQALLDIRTTADLLRINRIAFATAEEQGELSLILDKNNPEEGLLFSWGGAIDVDTVNAFFETNLLAGHLAGNWNGRLADSLKASTFAGTLQATDLQWFWRRDPEITYAIPSLRCRGNGSRVEIDSMLLGLGEESAQISGQLAGARRNLDIDLHLKAAALSWENVNRFLKNLRGDTTQKPSFTVTGDLAFDVATFTSPSFSLAPKAPEVAAPLYQWRPFQGVVRLQPENHLAAQISGAQLCGLNFTGNWFSDANLEQSYDLATPADGEGKFQDALPCLGVKQDLVEGDFTLQAKGRRRNDIWESGSVAINSTNGRILRMRLLSQIFSVINITDLFTQDAQLQAGDQGFFYSEMKLAATVEENTLLLNKAVIRGEGLNLFGSGDMDLASKEANFTVLIAPLKTLDAIVSNIPVIGRVVGGKHATVITIPVGIKGNITNPTVTPLSPEAIGDAVIELVKETLMLPFTILNPLLPADKPD